MSTPSDVPSTERPTRGHLQKDAHARLREMIVLQDLKPGAFVSEAQLSLLLGIGRSPVRVALQRLAMEGLVAIVPQRGVMVTEIDIGIQLKLLEVRRELERLVVQAAARRATPDHRAQMRDLADRMRATAAADDGLGFMAELKAVHHLTISAAGNEILETVISMVHGLSRRFWFAHYRAHADLNHAARLHASRLRAMAAGDPDRASACSDALVRYLEEFTLATIGARARGKTAVASRSIP